MLLKIFRLRQKPSKKQAIVNEESELRISPLKAQTTEKEVQRAK